jgi:DNA-directed RNA polymerase specialized sigma24 family protein
MRDSSSKPGRDRTLTREEFEEFLRRLDADREQSGKKYEELRSKLIRYFEFHAGSLPDVLADETINRVARKVVDGVGIDNIDAYALGVAWHIVQEYWRSNETKTISAEKLEKEPPSGIPNPEEELLRAETERQEEIRRKCMRQCLDELTSEELNLMRQYQMGEKSERIKNRETLAQKLGVTPIALRQRVHKSRVRLRNCLERRLKRTVTIGKTS